MKAILLGRNETKIIDDFSTLTHEQFVQLSMGKPIIYAGKEYLFKDQVEDGVIYYVEKFAWMDLHPLTKIDKQIKEQYGD